jgi:putative IMPACT (imprinted ancient) family translation regulator
MPILRSIDAQNLDKILVVMVRYFGGTLLGTGGLMVAYREATKDALKNAIIE